MHKFILITEVLKNKEKPKGRKASRSNQLTVNILVLNLPFYFLWVYINVWFYISLHFSLVLIKSGIIPSMLFCKLDFSYKSYTFLTYVVNTLPSGHVVYHLRYIHLTTPIYIYCYTCLHLLLDTRLFPISIRNNAVNIL